MRWRMVDLVNLVTNLIGEVRNGDDILEDTTTGEHVVDGLCIVAAIGNDTCVRESKNFIF